MHRPCRLDIRRVCRGDKFVTTNADTSNMFSNCPAGDDDRHLLNN